MAVGTARTRDSLTCTPAWGKVGILGAWWPAEEEEESLLFKGVLNIFFCSTPPCPAVPTLAPFAHFQARAGQSGHLGAWWPVEEEEESLLFKRVLKYSIINFFSSAYTQPQMPTLPTLPTLPTFAPRRGNPNVRGIGEEVSNDFFSSP
jgi:hypothetical protein